MKRRVQVVLIFLGIVACVIGTVILSVWRPVRQERLNQALITAIKQKKIDTAILALQEGAEARARDIPPGGRSFWRQFLGRVPSHTPQLSGAPTALQLLLDEMNDAKDKKEQATGLARLLLKRGADPNEPDADGWTPLHQAVMSFGPDMIQLLLTCGADPNEPDSNRPPYTYRTPLMLAAGFGDPEELKILLDGGARINTRNADGATALAYAVQKCQDGNVAYLLKRHADFRIPDKYGKTVLALAQASFKEGVTKTNHHSSDGIATWQKIIDTLEQAGAKK